MKTLMEEFTLLRSNALVRRRHHASATQLKRNGHSSNSLGMRFSKKRSDLDDADDIDSDDLGDGSGNSEDKIRLLRPEEDLETGLGQDINISIHQPPPPYVGRVEALQYSLSRLEGKISELDSAHKAYLARPTLDDNPKEEELIKQLTKDLSEMFSSCHHQVKSIRKAFLTSTEGVEGVLANNVSTYLVSRLQDATQAFSQSQSDYVKRVKSREEKSQLIDFGDDELTASQGGFLGEDVQKQVWSRSDVFLLDENTKVVQLREREIQSVVKSISDLNVIFKELAVMISEQGQVVDRIDHNIENTSLKVEAGLNELKKADQYQKKNRKMKCIVIEAVIVVVLLFILIVFKT